MRYASERSLTAGAAGEGLAKDTAKNGRFVLRHRLVAAAASAVSGYYFLSILWDLAVSRGSSLTICETGYVLLFSLACGITSVSAVGLALLRRWAWYGALAGSALLAAHLMASGIASCFYKDPGDLIVMPFIFMWWMVIYGADPMGPLLLFYLTRPDVRRLFTGERQTACKQVQKR